MACVRLKQEAACHRLSGCISTSGDDDRRRWRSNLGGDDAPETSATVRRHSRVLSRWIARETITATLDDRRRREAELVALAELHTASILQRWRELEEESRAEVSIGRSSRENSPETGGDVERERVRQIVGMMDSLERHGSIRDESSRGEWLGERERERVRVVRERVWMASEREGRRGERERESRGGGTGEVPRLRGRQARDDVIMRMARERQRELQGLSQHRAVSAFAYRNRIHLSLRGRFLRRSNDDERPRSLADSELGLIRQRHSVSGLREGSSFRGETTSTGHANSGPHSNAINDELISTFRSNTQESTMEVPSNNQNQSEINTQNPVVNLPIQTDDTIERGNTVPDVSTEQSLTAQGANHVEEHTSSQGRVEEETDISWEVVENGEPNLEENIEEWSQNAFEDTAESWQNLLSHHIPGPHLVSGQITNRFSDTDDDATYGVEIRELLSRRSVSTLLSSNFRESLDQLIQSYVQRQENTPLDWDLEEAVSPATSSPAQEQTQERNNTTDELYTDQDLRSIPPPPVPREPLWRSDMHTGGWTRQTIHQPEIDWDVVNVLREEMTRLQEGMGNLQRMLEACMEMQLEVQRSVRQEVSAALNRSLGYTGMEGEDTGYGSKWSHVRKGTCCVCCDSHIDSLLYRCGHMCTCTKCANELARGGDKCPLCRAPIVEVIRAYSIL
ncbi:RING/U-box superfamily protein [Rhynchospora pubera]|uniref:RING/U-box superfamily protein n=1 Tax=Rhynchospora pubera TaxID=906938 RepID=A0AAV8GI78_9POAL|nr:RING/U-box superfamily protein [Rhynchospora pubera]